MKKKITYLFGGAFALGIVFMNSNQHAIANLAGSPGGRSGSTGDAGNTCVTSGCHVGTVTASSTPIITTDIPAGGYVPGTNYQITLAGQANGATKVGFEMSSENSSGVQTGTFASGSIPREQILNNGHVTHIATSADDITLGAYGWTFDWIAPAAGSGDITFSVAVNLTDGNGNTQGDNVVTYNLTVTEDVSSTSIVKTENEIFSVYPNPVNDLLRLTLNNENSNVIIYNVAGEKVFSKQVNVNSTIIDFSNFNKGVYFVSVYSNGKLTTKKVIKK